MTTTPPESIDNATRHDPAAYAARVQRITESIMTTGELPHAHGVAQRTSSWACMPFCCGLCCFWSTCWRVVACPFMCICKGAGFACSNNGCTNITDAMLHEYVNSINKREDNIGVLTPKDVSSQLLDAITEVEGHFRGVTTGFTSKHHTLAKAVVAPLCRFNRTSSNDLNSYCCSSNALELLAALRIQLVALTSPVQIQS